MIKNVISINPNNVKYWDELLNLYTSLPKDNKDRKQLLLGTVNKIIQLDPVNPYPKLTAGSILFSYSDFQQAESVVNAAINLKPDLNISRYALANIYAQTGNFQNAIPEMQKALDLTSPKDQDYEKLKNQLNQLQQLAVEATKSATPTKK